MNGSDPNAIVSHRETQNNGYTQDFEGKIDYAMPIKENSKLETGWSARLRTIDNGMSIFDNASLGRRYDFIYHENIYGLYAQYGSKINKFSYQAGVRGEYADTQGDLREQNQDTSLAPQKYYQFYPTAFIMYQIAKNNELKLNYSRRVNRPGPWNLNPYQDYTDPMNIRTGNPELKPEYINSFELDYFHYLKTGNFSSTLYYRNTTNVISRVTEVDDKGVSVSTWDNLNTNDAYGLELNFNSKFFNVWSLNASSNLGYYKLNGNLSSSGQSVSRDGFSWTLRAGNSFQVTDVTAVQFNARYVGPRVTAQGKFQGFFAGDIGFKQDFLKKTLSLTLNVRDVFNTMKFSSVSESENFYQKFSREPKGCVGYLTLTWKFGNMNMRDTKKRQSSSDQREPEEGLEMF
jgi:outer membrane receptor protein involved in Fe transport